MLHWDISILIRFKVYGENERGKNTPGTQAAEKMNGNCYVLLSLYNIFSPW